MDSHPFDVKTVDNVMSELKRGKAAGFDEITSEHILYSHPALSLVLTRLFNIMLVNGVLPDNFYESYTVPIHKTDNTGVKELNVSDFRGISICPVLSKVFEICLIRRCDSLLLSSDYQMGLKKV